MKLKSCEQIETTGLQRLTEGCKPCQTLSARSHNMAIIAAKVYTRVQCCCNKVSVHAMQLQLATQGNTHIWRPWAEHCQVCTAPPTAVQYTAD